jgi:hypothetical protein
VPGLRGEEVARLAGVSSDYYIRLEPGRDLAAALQTTGLTPSADAVQAQLRRQGVALTVPVATLARNRTALAYDDVGWICEQLDLERVLIVGHSPRWPRRVRAGWRTAGSDPGVCDWILGEVVRTPARVTSSAWEEASSPSAQALALLDTTAAGVREPIRTLLAE